MKKRIPLFFLSVLCCILLFVLPLSPAAHADIASGTCDGVPWVITDDGELLIGTDGTDTYFMTDAATRLVNSYNWYPYANSVTSVRFLGTVHGNGSMREMFSGYTALVNADLRNFRAGTGGYANLSGLFRDCAALRNVQLTGIDSGYVKDFNTMFDGCASLSTLDVSGLNTASATDLSHMFRGCSGLTSLNLSGFTVTNVTNMGGMFQGCTGLQTLTLGNFATATAPACYDMFGNCSSLRSLDLTTLDLTGTVTNMFYGLNSLESISFGNYALNDSQFGSLSHLWGVSDEGYATSRTAAIMAANYPSGSGRTFERVIEAGYDSNGGAPDGVVNDIVRLSQGTSYALKTPAAMGITPPGGREFKAWTYGGNNYAAGTAVNLASAGTDSVTISAVWRYAVSWTWTADGTAATASYNDGSLHSVPADSITVLSDTASCDSDGLLTRRATVTIAGEAYTDDHEVASPAHHTLSYAAGVPVGCTTNGSREHWHCSVCNKDFLDAAGTVVTTDLVIPQTGHNWGTPEYTWAANNASVTARRVCANDTSHVESETRPTTATVDREATCTELGVRTFTTTPFVNTAFTAQRKTVEDIPALGHNYPAAWTSDATGHWHVCTRCQQRDAVIPHTSSGKASVEHNEHCTICNFEITPKLIIRSFAYFDSTGSMALDTITFTKEKDDIDVWLVTLPDEEPTLKNYYFEGWSSSRDSWDHSPGETMLYTYSEAREVTFRGIWTKVIDVGNYDLDADTRYRFAGSTYQISGDDTVYQGDQPFYPTAGGNFDVAKAG